MAKKHCLSGRGRPGWRHTVSFMSIICVRSLFGATNALSPLSLPLLAMLALLLGAAALAAAEAACQSDCSLNGVCSSGRCVCDRPCERPLAPHAPHPQPLPLPLSG